MRSQLGNSSGIGLSGVLLVVFIVLKLTGVIDWSWLWVLSPLWIPMVLFLSFVAITALFVSKSSR